MNFLELCQRTRLECGLARSSTSLPATVTGQVGQLGQIVEWVRQAWSEIQGSQRWSFLWEEAIITIDNAQSTTAGAETTTWMRYDTTSAHIGDANLAYMAWDRFRVLYRTVPEGVSGQLPTVWTVDPSNQVRVNLVVADNTEITIERWKNPTVPAADADALPTRMRTDHHMIVVWKAVMTYSGDRDGASMYAAAFNEYSRIHQEMLREYLPSPESDAPLV